MAQSKRWVITTSPDHPFADVAQRLSGAGLDIHQRLEAIGVVVGAADDALADRLRGIGGVTDVSPDTDIDVGPPDSPKTW